MTSRTLEFHRFSRAAPNAVEFVPRDLVIAGWTGRDQAAVEHHIEELALLGVKRPSSTPVYYRVAAGFLTQSEQIQVLGQDSSGEAEPVLFSMREGLFLGIGSDHTDRKVEAYSVAVSKQMCAKPVSRVLWDCREICGHWDELIVRSYIDEGKKRVLYQEGRLAQIRQPQNLIDGYVLSGKLPVGTVMFLGTFGAKGGVRFATRFEMELFDPVLKRTIRHGYTIEAIPEVA